MAALNKLSAVSVRVNSAGKYEDGVGLRLVKASKDAGKWVFRFTAFGRRREMGLGALSDVSLRQARELATDWRSGRDGMGAISKIMERVKGFFEAMVSALNGGGFVDAASVFRKIADGKMVDGKPPSGPNGRSITHEKLSRDGDIVATLSGDELGSWKDIRQLGRKAEAWYRENQIGKSVTNAATGMEIFFNVSGAEKIRGRKGDILYRSVVALREILEGGELVSSDRTAVIAISSKQSTSSGPRCHWKARPTI